MEKKTKLQRTTCTARLFMNVGVADSVNSLSRACRVDSGLLGRSRVVFRLLCSKDTDEKSKVGSGYGLFGLGQGVMTLFGRLGL